LLNVFSACTGLKINYNKTIQEVSLSHFFREFDIHLATQVKILADTDLGSYILELKCSRGFAYRILFKKTSFVPLNVEADQTKNLSESFGCRV
jgi:hypothetical protein